jgi:signal transduction histidine kinase/DNA-binding response OmpR family regulator/CHASE3 domain sensor protein
VRKRGTDESVASRLFVAFIAPLIALGAIGALLTLQVVKMERAARDVEKSDELIGQLEDGLRQTIDQETGLRGYLVTGDRLYLEPYERARPLDVLSGLERQSLVPGQADRVARIRERYMLWYTQASAIVRPDQPLAPYKTTEDMRGRKEQMDATRAAFASALAAERSLRAERAATSEGAYQTSLYELVPVSLIVGILLALLSRRQINGVAATYSAALEREKESKQRVEEQNWVRQQHVLLAKSTEGDPSREQLGRAFLQILCEVSSAVAGAAYFAEPGGFRRCAGVALGADAPEFFADGEGLVGSAARGKEMRVIEDVPADHLRVISGTGASLPVRLALIPAAVDGIVHGLIELAFFGAVENRALALFERASETIGAAMQSVAQRMRLRELLEESQRQSEELQAQHEEMETQQEELRVSNEELAQQSDALKLAQAQLEERKEELEASNVSLLSQRDALERSQSALEARTVELSRTSQYKSEFLANMSHELRTPLNSALILAKLLADNKQGNLLPEQVKFAQTIHNAGNDLLTLINDILDLSKVEAGKIDIHIEGTTVSRLIEPLIRTMEPVAREKKIDLVTKLGEDSAVETDIQRIQQILLNLLSNAFKFTKQGEVTVEVDSRPERVEISVVDTGIGIAKEQQQVVFEAFRQADGTTNRKYGGTGLGLSIARELSRLLGGELVVDSEVGKGSRFTLSLPRRYLGPRASTDGAGVEVASSLPPRSGRPRSVPAVASNAMRALEGKGGNGSNGSNGGRRLLVVEDDLSFAEILSDLAKELEFDCVVAGTADEGVRLASELVPSAILLDMKLPDHSGLSVLDRLKRNPTTRHIPVHVVSVDTNVEPTLAMGAIGHLTKPVRRDDVAAVLKKLKEPFTRLRRVLVVEDDVPQRDAIVKLLEAPGLEIVPVATVGDALKQLSAGTFDCVVTDLTLPDASGYDLLETMAKDDAYSFPPVIVYTGRDLSRDDEQRLRRYSSSIIVKGARSPERLLDEITLFLHQVEAELPPDRQRMLRQARDREAAFEGRKVLLAEDDIRNIFALASVLEPKGVELLIARNGKEALELLDRTPDVELVLMDIMMPEMDGLTAMEEIRKRKDAYAKVPIIALTAKAMRDDQERCLRAGANDYVPKPLDVDVLLSLMRVWMQR